MTATLEIVATGALLTVQDLGRTGWRRFGVPRAGALDADLLRLANRLAGQDDAAPVLECLLAGPTLRALDAPVRLACAGDMPLTLQRADGSQALPSWRSLTLQPGQTLRVGALATGRVGYIAAAGLAVPTVLGSASTDVRAGLGGPAGRALAVGDRLVVAAIAPLRPGEPGGERWLRDPPRPDDTPIRVVPGPQDDHFDAAAWATFLGSEYRVSPAADRMGLRLDGPALHHRPERGAEIVSDAAVPGCIQVPGNGQPIVLLADGQTAGGYPKIATVVSADLARLAGAAVGARLRFQAVSVAEAEALAREHEAQLCRRLDAVEPLALHEGVDLAALYQGNLISAMIDALAPPPPAAQEPPPAA